MTMDFAAARRGVDDGAREGETGVDRLMRLAEEACFFQSTDGRLFARVPVESRSETYGLRSRAFRDWLVGGYVRECRELPSDGAVRRVLGAVEAVARFDGGGAPTAVIRVGRDGTSDGSHYYIDLGDVTGRAVEIGARGWEIVDKPTASFRRTEGMLPLPVPSREGSIELLRPFVNLIDRDFRLLVVWMAAALRPAGPYPILALYGEQGSAKSTLARVIRELIDPQAAPLLLEPRSTRDLMVTAVNGWLLAYDNIGVVPAWLSDGLCLLATGGGFAGRVLFSDDERMVMHAQRPVILNGIEEFVRRGDLSDRSVFLELPPIDPRQRRREEDFWDAFRQEQPRMLGGLLDAVAGGLRERQSVKLPELPRMADFATFAEAVGRALGWGAGTVLKDYNANRKQASGAQIESSIVGSAMLKHAATDLHWSGTASDLHSELSRLVGKKVASSARWPKSPGWLTNEVRRIAPSFASKAYSLRSRETTRRRITVRTAGGKKPIASGLSPDDVERCFEMLFEEEKYRQT